MFRNSAADMTNLIKSNPSTDTATSVAMECGSLGSTFRNRMICLNPNHRTTQRLTANPPKLAWVFGATNESSGVI